MTGPRTRSSGPIILDNVLFNAITLFIATMLLPTRNVIIVLQLDDVEETNCCAVKPESAESVVTSFDRAVHSYRQGFIRTNARLREQQRKADCKALDTTVQDEHRSPQRPAKQRKSDDDGSSMEGETAAARPRIYLDASLPDAQGLVHRLSQPQDSEMLAIAAAKYMKMPSFDHDSPYPPIRRSRRCERVAIINASASAASSTGKDSLISKGPRNSERRLRHTRCNGLWAQTSFTCSWALAHPTIDNICWRR